MKKYYFITAILIIALSIGTVFASGGGYAGWYKVNGMYGVIDSVALGSYTPTEAFYTIIVPADDAGYVTENEAKLYIQYYPETEQLFVSYGIIGESTTGNTTEAPNTQETAPQPAYTIEECDMNKYASTNVNIRTEPDGNAGLVGSVTQNEQVHVTGKTSNGWYRIEYNGMTGFSVSKYFSDVKVETVEGVTDSSEVASEPTSEPKEPESEEPKSEETETSEPVASEKPVSSESITSESETRTEIAEPTSEEPVSEVVSEIVSEEVSETVSEEVSEETSEVTETETPVTEPEEEKNSVLPYIIIGAVVVICIGGAVTVVVLNRKKQTK